MTRACGTGACAAAVAAVRQCFAQRDQRIDVCLDGGALSVCWCSGESAVSGGGGECVVMTGPAAYCYRGTLHEELLAASEHGSSSRQ